MLTDNGTEFKNKILKSLMHHLQVDFQFSPAYHPQSNQTERSNRFITETLRSIVNESGASVRDWARYVKFIEFAMRRAPIPGTNLTPFMAMRGRDPVLPIDLPLVSQAPVSNDTMDEHVKRLKANLTVSAKLVKSAMERTKERNKDLHDLSQKQVVFDVGEMVRYWHLPKSTNGNAAKLKLRNGVYEITGKHNNRYNIRHVNYPHALREPVARIKSALYM